MGMMLQVGMVMQPGMAQLGIMQQGHEASIPLLMGANGRYPIPPPQPRLPVAAQLNLMPFQQIQGFVCLFV